MKVFSVTAALCFAFWGILLFTTSYYALDKGDIIFAIFKIIIFFFVTMLILFFTLRFGNNLIFQTDVLDVRLKSVLVSCSSSWSFVLINVKKSITMEDVVVLYIPSFIILLFIFMIGQFVSGRFTREID